MNLRVGCAHHDCLCLVGTAHPTPCASIVGRFDSLTAWERDDRIEDPTAIPLFVSWSSADWMHFSENADFAAMLACSGSS